MLFLIIFTVFIRFMEKYRILQIIIEKNRKKEILRMNEAYELLFIISLLIRYK